MITQTFSTIGADSIITRRKEVKDYIKENFPENSKVLDIGGGADCWGLPEVTHIADMFVDPNDKITLEKESPNVELFCFNVEHYEEWEVLEDYCDKNGLFDFVICSHTLEDLNAPFVCCKKMNKIGKAGYIALPSRYAEMVRFECYYPTNDPIRGYKGFHHHRWMYRLHENKLLGYPKQNWIEYLSEPLGSRSLSDQARETGTNFIPAEFSFLWKEDFNFKFYHASEMLDNRQGVPLSQELLSTDDLD